MVFLKKEWKAIGFMIGLVGVVVWLFCINSQLKRLGEQNTKIISTFDSIESIAISNDASLTEMDKKVAKIQNNVSYIARKVKRR